MITGKKDTADELQRRIAELESTIASQDGIMAHQKLEIKKSGPMRVERDLFCDLAKVFATADSFDALFLRTIDVLSARLKASYFGVFWLTDDNESFTFRHGKGYRPGVMSLIPLSGSLMGECLYLRKPVWEPDLSRRSDYIPLNQDPREYNILLAPLAFLGHDAGVIRIANIDPSSVEPARAVLETVAPLLSSSLERLLLYEKNDRTRKGLETSFTIAKLLEDTLVETDILKNVCAQVPRLIACAACVVAVIDQEKRLRPAFVWPDGFCLGGSPDSSVIYLGNLLEAFPKGAGLVENTLRDKRWSWPQSKVRSLCVSPLRVRGALRGMLIAASPATEAYDASHASLLGLAASQASMTLERAAYLRQQEDMARADGLTGLLNHRVFQENVREEIERARRYKRPLSLVMLDIDHFKAFNDTHGHPVGDEVLKMVARTVKGLIRRTDRAYRYGGEEFCVLLPETALLNAEILAERLREKIEFNRTVRNLVVTASLGLAELCEDDTAQTLIQRCDLALYRSKQGGRNRVTRI